MDIKKEFEECKKQAPKGDELAFADSYRSNVFDGYNQALFFYLGAKRAEELLFQDPLVVDLRKVWEEVPHGFNFLSLNYQDNANNYPMTVKIFPRPKPAWVPVKGEKVCWMLEGDDFVGYGLFQKASDSGLYFIESNGSGVAVPKDRVKPASMENIGKRWEEIN